MLQVLTLHSTFSVENATSCPLQLTLHLQRAPQAYTYDGSSTGGGTVCSVPADGPLAPGAQCFLPQPAAWWVSSLSHDFKPVNMQLDGRQHFCRSKEAVAGEAAWLTMTYD